MNLPHEVERLGPEVRCWVEEQLLDDLGHYGVERRDLVFDWSQVVQEGHWMDFRGRMLESLSDVLLRDLDGRIAADGWIDFVLTSADGDAVPRLFWLLLSVAVDGKLQKVKSDALLPMHIWDAMSSDEKHFVAGTESKWLDRDPKLQAWRQQNKPPSG